VTRSSETLTPPNALQQKDMPPAEPFVGCANGAPAGGALPAHPTVCDDAGDIGARPAEPQWIRICAVDEIPRLGARVVKRAAGPNVAIFRTGTDDVFALADRCPHRGGPLSQGIVFGDRVACPLHNTCVDLDTGCAVAPDKGQVASYAVKVEDGTVYVDLKAHADDHHG